MKKDRLLKKIDYIIIAVIMLVYSLIAFYNLGDMQGPQTYAETEGGVPYTIELSENTSIGLIKLYMGPCTITKENPFSIELYDDKNESLYSGAITSSPVFAWTDIAINSAPVSKIVFHTAEKSRIMELAVFDTDGKRVIPIKAPDNLCDESEKAPLVNSYKNSSYFDEIYHARTAFEFSEGLGPVYEWTHPPLGKAIISAGIEIFGMTPFGWRFMGTLFGILMLPLIYIFIKRVTKNTFFTTCGTLLFTFDFMHFAQTRIATIDVYVTFFIMLMYYFMYKYYTSDFSKGITKTHHRDLFFSGLFMGFAVATKWTGVYAGAGLAILFFMTLCKNYKYGIIYKKSVPKTIWLCVLFFGAIPLAIYVLSYIPHMNCEGTGLLGVWKNQEAMLTYHGKTVLSSTHYFDSPWYEWPVNVRPIWYYAGGGGKHTEVINSFGNPIVWLVGLIALFYCAYDAYKTKDRTSAFFVIAYLAQLVPWIFVTRLTFIYHYFPCVPFIVIMTIYAALKLQAKYKNTKWVLLGITILAIILFVIFYPILSGYPIDNEFVKEYLRFLPTWHFTN